MLQSKTSLLAAFLFFILFSACTKEEIINNNADDFALYLQDEMEMQNMPALSVLIFKENEVLYENQMGKSNIAQNNALQSNDLFLLASVSKVITATALLQLQEQGHFSLDDSINDHLPFNVSVPGYENTHITFRMLLTHTSGIAESDLVYDQYYYGEDSPVSLADFLENYLATNGNLYDEKENFYDFEPGKGHEYSNIGNALIGLLVEQISGMDFNDYCKQNIFEPLGMTNTFWRLDEINQTIVQPYDYVKGEYQEIQHYTFTDYPNGGLRSTAKDLFRFLSAFTQNGTFNNHQILQSATIQEMIRPQIPTLSNDMGLHLFLINSENNLWGHDGGEQGVATIVAFNPTSKIGAIILTNQGEADLEDMLIEAYEFGVKL
ncbi:MAG: serine hydrolase domain-containing protein [Chitinophagales bacterium]